MAERQGRAGLHFPQLERHDGTTLETRAAEVADRAIGAVGWTAGKHGG